MSRIVRFDASCIYKGLPDGKEPVNKLFGFCELGPSVMNWMGEDEQRRALHHYNSARFGWNCDEKGQLWLYGYSYADGERETKRICKAKPEVFIECHIKLTPDGYLFKVYYDVFIEAGKDSYETFTQKLKRGPSGSRAFGYGLFPFFGGSGTCPHKMKISLSRP